MIKHLVAIVDPHYDVLMTFGGASEMRHMDEGHSGFFFQFNIPRSGHGGLGARMWIYLLLTQISLSKSKFIIIL